MKITKAQMVQKILNSENHKLKTGQMKKGWLDETQKVKLSKSWKLTGWVKKENVFKEALRR